MRSALLKVFSPAHEITEPRFFAGRIEQVRAVGDALRTTGSCPIIYGDRGLGKSSLAVQAQLIAMGDTELLQRHDSIEYALDESEYFMTFYLVCSDEIANFRQLLQSLINRLEEVDIEPDGRSHKGELVDRQTRRKLALKVFELEVTKTYRQEVGRVKHEKLNLTEKFLRIARLLIETYGLPLLFVVDELDRVNDLRGLSSFAKAVSGEQIKLLLVGIAQSVSELVADHQSIARITTPVNVPRMKAGELADIVDGAMESLREQRLNFKLSNSARSRLVKYANGFPWFIHVLGQSALLAAYDSGKSVITEEEISAAALGLSNNRFAQHFADTYQQAVRDSVQRELVLRAFATWSANDIPTSEINRVLKYRLGVSNPSIYKRHLASEEYGAVLIAPRYQKRGLVRFRNEMFKQYVVLRTSLYRGIDATVREAFAQAHEHSS